MPTSFLGDPAGVLDYVVDWSKWLAGSPGDTLSASTWTVPTGITEAPAGHSMTTTMATIWLTGGTVGVEYKLTNHITTAQGRQNERSFTVTVVER